MSRLMKALRDTSGATAVEYGLICALIVLACVGGMSVLGDGVDEHYQGIENAM
ncbi:Flp family type IVb pilin [Sphingomicrobium flavum]|uniref:Flp family type IVb pilin n=1 Tax=Sphingomicrobium flavum TaxID=1229164 RepID=UPI0021ADA10B|nr:Flp family type IVb pilin [Sphingomicrobium flavum]